MADPAVRHNLSRALHGGFRQAAHDVLSGHVDAPANLLNQLPETWWFDPHEVQVVVTGFGPFLDHARNPSWEVAQAFAEVVSARFSTSCERVNVTYADAACFAERAEIVDGQRLVVHFGLRGSGTDVALERYAHNGRGPTRDESGERDWPEVLVPGGPVALETLLPVRELAGALDSDLQVDARVSRDVGEYVCNAIYYHSLRSVWAARGREHAAEALFVHVPPLDPESAEEVGASFGHIFGARLAVLCG